MRGRSEKGSYPVSISPPSPPGARFDRPHFLFKTPADVAGVLLSGAKIL